MIEPDLSNPEAEKIQEIIETEINPFVASHGGQISLVGVKDDIVYVRMEGGCHGCSQSAVTLRDGIVNVLKTAFPQVKDVVDVTDHKTGMNPYF